MRTLIWFRGKDLRLADHVALHKAAKGDELIALFVLDPYYFSRARAPRFAHRLQFLLESLAELRGALAERGSELFVVEGRASEVVPALARTLRVDHVFAQRSVTPFARDRDRVVVQELEQAGTAFTLCEGETLLPPEALRTQAGSPFSVFTRFKQAFEHSAEIARPLPVPRLPPVPRQLRVPRVAIPALEDLGIVRNPALLPGGEQRARARLRAFLRGPAARYDRERDQLGLAATSRLSADLKFGTLSARTLFRALRDQLGHVAAADKFIGELLWREFTYSTLWDRPELLHEPFRRDFVGFPWRKDRADFMAWCEGRTGYPVVDAASRQLRAEGFVHNRARMLAASFLTKHLLIDYRLGEAHYLSYLTDGDLPQNNANWQWIAGSGCDAQPYFRVFNPAAQGEKFDADGSYVRRWLPELSRIPDRHLHEPFRAPEAVLRKAGVRLGVDYPFPMVDHAEARERFLAVAREHLRNVR